MQGLRIYPEFFKYHPFFASLDLSQFLCNNKFRAHYPGCIVRICIFAKNIFNYCSHLYSQIILIVCWVLPSDSRCYQRTRDVGLNCWRVKSCTAWFPEEMLHPIARSSILLPGIKDNSIWVPPAKCTLTYQ